MVWVEGPEGGQVKVKAMVTRRVGAGVAFMPFHFGGHFEGEDLRDKYPEGSDPYVLGEAAKHGADLWLRLRYPDAGNEIVSLQNSESLITTGELNHG